MLLRSAIAAEMKGTTTSMEPNLSTIRARRAQLANYRQQIDAEDKELEIAERVLTRLAVGTNSPVAPAVLMSGSSQLDEPSAEARTGAGPSISLTFSAERFLHTTWHQIRLQSPRF
jgi:hypothetical protein